MRTQNVLSRSKKYAHLHHIRDSGHKDVNVPKVIITRVQCYIIFVAGIQLELPIKPTWRNR